MMWTFLNTTFIGLFFGAAYAIAASGLVLTYTTTRVFNMAHGAIGMVMAFLFWELHVQHHVQSLLAMALVLLVIAPIFGIVVERVMMRGLGNAPVSVSLVITVGLFVVLIGAAQYFWPPAPRSVDYFFGLDGAKLGKLFVPYHYLITVLLSAVVAAGLYVLLNRTRIGTAMRAAVDNPELLSLFGARSRLVSMMSWAVSSSLAALGGIMLVAVVQLDYFALTFLVIAAYAAAMLGRLKSLPRTFVGAMLLGLTSAYLGQYLPTNNTTNGIRVSLPTIMLFLILIFVPQVSLRVGQVKGLNAAPVPGRFRSVWVSIALVAFVGMLVPTLSSVNTHYAGLAGCYAIVMLSLVLLTGYGGHVSLGQMSFMGVGATVVAKMHSGSLLTIALAVLVSAIVGGLVALPVLRLAGLYLALATMAFAQMMDKLIFQTKALYDYNGSIQASRLELFGVTLRTDASYTIVITAVFCLAAIALLEMRRGAIGRLLIAMRDSQAACGTLGLNQRWFRVGLFAASAGIAGLGGALYAGFVGTVSAGQFQMFNSLLLLLLAVVAGVTSASGAALGGLGLMLLPVFQSKSPTLAALLFVVVGAGAVALGRDPNGLANKAFIVGRFVRRLIPIRMRPPAKPQSEIRQPIRLPEADHVAA